MRPNVVALTTFTSTFLPFTLSGNSHSNGLHNLRPMLSPPINNSHARFSLFFIAIFTHNIPEGFSLGLSVADVHHLENGYIMSLILFIHNIIIAFAMSSSLKDSKLKNDYIVLLTLLSSLPAYVFAIVGYHLGDLLFSNLLAKAILLAISAGSLMFILAKELLPPLFTTYKSKLTPIYLLLGVCVFACLLFIHVH